MEGLISLHYNSAESKMEREVMKMEIVNRRDVGIEADKYISYISMDISVRI